MPDKTAVGYVRVSTISQVVKGQSLSTQQKAIEGFCEKENFNLIKIYRDEGISGGSVDNRPGLLRLLENINGIDYVVVHRLSRLGRNVRELLNNIDFLRQANVEVIFQKDNLDLSTPHGKLMLQLLGAIAEFEKDITREASLENKIARCRQGIPATGKTPFGRNYNRETGEWYYDPPDIKDVFQNIIDRFLKGESLREIAATVPKTYKLSYTNILRVIHNVAGDTWQVKFKDLKEPIKYEIPSLLDNETIEKVERRLKLNRICNRSDAHEKYILSGFIRCGVCGKAMSGQVQKYKDIKHKYYVHPGGKWHKCKALSSIKTARIEEAVFQSIIENTFDKDGFNEAIKENYPDSKERNILKNEVKVLKKKVNKITKDQDKLVEALLNDTISSELIRKKDRELNLQKQDFENRLKKKEILIKNMPSQSELKEQGESIRLQLENYFGSKERFDKMNFDDKRRLLLAVFDGSDEDGKPYGVYLEKIESRVYEYFIYAKLFNGVRYLNKDDYDYEPFKDSKEFKKNFNKNYKTKTGSIYHGCNLQ